MITVTRSFEWDMGHRVTNHKSLCRNPHGHRYKMEVTIGGLLNETAGHSAEGMVLDFGDFKNVVNESVVAKLDHSFMFWQKDAVMRAFAKKNDDLKFVPVPFVPTAECIATFIASELKASLRKPFPGMMLEQVVVYETPNCKAIWQKD